MKKHLSSINYENSIETYKSIDESYIVYNLAKINLFIGANNSGKSRFLRGVFNNEEYLFLSWEIEGIEKLNDLIIKFEDVVLGYLRDRYIDRVVGLNYNSPRINIETIHKYIPIIYNEFKKMTTFRATEYVKSSQFYSGSIEVLNNLINNEAKKVLAALEITYPNSSFTKCYIPMLRGLRPIGEKSSKTSLFPYTERTLKDYFPAYFTEINPGIDKKGFQERIITGLNFYDDCKIMLLGSSAQRKMIEDFETFLSKNFFNGKEINIIPRIREDGDDTNIVYLLMDEEERPIHEFGDGIQSIITLTYHMFFNKDK